MLRPPRGCKVPEQHQQYKLQCFVKHGMTLLVVSLLVVCACHATGKLQGRGAWHAQVSSSCLQIEAPTPKVCIRDACVQPCESDRLHRKPASFKALCYVGSTLLRPTSAILKSGWWIKSHSSLMSAAAAPWPFAQPVISLQNSNLLSNAAG